MVVLFQRHNTPADEVVLCDAVLVPQADIQAPLSVPESQQVHPAAFVQKFGHPAAIVAPILLPFQAHTLLQPLVHCRGVQLRAAPVEDVHPRHGLGLAPQGLAGEARGAVEGEHDGGADPLLRRRDGAASPDQGRELPDATDEHELLRLGLREKRRLVPCVCGLRLGHALRGGRLLALALGERGGRSVVDVQEVRDELRSGHPLQVQPLQHLDRGPDLQSGRLVQHALGAQQGGRRRVEALEAEALGLGVRVPVDHRLLRGPDP
mmetsp:Transcript_122903/g.353017  ORF Transcript_122903/g.353017 Transcript_122903/m.353017 type:complete len:264 (-) Transcript_122903:191-982(-)